MRVSIVVAVWILSFVLPISQTLSSSTTNDETLLNKKIEGKVLELDESNFESAIASFDYVFVDFYAPWCGHCKRLSPELDVAAPILAGLKQPIVIVKVNAEKYKRLASKYDVDGYPTLKIFMHGVPVDYYGPRKSDLLVLHLKKFVAPDVAILSSDSAVREFIEEAGISFPLFIGFGLNETKISNLAIKYKKKAWFLVADDFTDDLMEHYDFNKVPALVSLRPIYNEQSIFYGPFEEKYLEEFIRQNFLPLVVPINRDTLKILRDDDRKIILTILEDESEANSQKLIKLLKAAASANHDLVFGYVGLKQWEDFPDTFGVNKKTKLPKMIVWDGDEEYISVTGSENLEEEDQGTQISRFLEGYREGRTVQHRVSGPSLIGFINSLISIRTAYIIVFMVAVMILILTIGKEPLGGDTGGTTDSVTGSRAESADYRPGDKED